jgi:hypothetical protein
VKDIFDVTIHDCVTDIDSFFSAKTSYRIGLDYNGPNQTQFSMLFFLIDHFKQRRLTFKGLCYEGLEFALIREQVKNAWLKVKAPFRERITLAIGASSQVEIYQETLRHLKDINFPIDLFSFNAHLKDLPPIELGDNVFIRDGDSLVEGLTENKFAVCNAGTTALECLALGIQPILVARNWYEQNFLEKLQNLSLGRSLNQMSTTSLRSLERYSHPLINLNGDERIVSLITEFVRTRKV